MKKTAVLALLIMTAVDIIAGHNDSLQVLFDKGIQDISIGRFARAMPVFEQLCTIEPDNPNFNYLLGICLTEQNIQTMKSVACLELAEKAMSKHYDVGSFKEKKVPIYVYYYLTLAYSQNNMCDKAGKTRDRFFSYYNFYVEYDYFIENAKKWVDKCVPEKELITLTDNQQNEARSTDTAVVDRFVEEIRNAPISGRKVLAKEVYYSGTNALWGVQVGAFRQYLPVGVFDDLKNVDAFLDKDGMVRYVIGHFAHRKQAESILEAVQEAGYEDAFIVNVLAEKKFTSEVLMVDDYYLKRRLSGEVELKVQIGVFRDSIPKDLAEKYLQVNNIEEYDQDGLSMMAVGSFSNYGSAAAYRDELLEMGIPGAFIIAMNRGEKVPLKQALAYLKKHFDQGM